jgi:hypothetical protein
MVKMVFFVVGVGLVPWVAKWSMTVGTFQRVGDVGTCGSLVPRLVTNLPF